MNQRRIKLKIEYDGTDFSGWQRQLNQRTIQEDIEQALSSVLCEDITIIGAGRTDAGVHAFGQVAHFATDNILPYERILKGSNSLLKKDVRIWDIEEVPASFHARFSAVSRSYRYRLLKRNHPLQRRYTWYPNYSWDDKPIKEALRLLPGRHSFKSFSRARPDEEEYICDVIEASWDENGDTANFNITADRFMHKMVRGLVGALIDVGRGYLTVDDFQELLDKPKKNGATKVAQARGLTLVEVKY
ncbi:MAG: tRNA pseudouridine(38-40) synthase TruA [Candidatus Hatepunaea meridiana]|nr:tRNA pseudouridine(38-40) synthase TruA [Candidatus Hatepunaea meridiana]